MCREIFGLQYFHDSNPSGPLIDRLKSFQNGFRFRRDIKIFKILRGVHPTLESDSAVCITAQSQALRCASHCGVKLRGVHHTAKSSDEQFSKNSAVCISPRSQAPRCASYRRVNNLSSVCFIPKFYKCYFYVMPKDIHTKLIL